MKLISIIIPVLNEENNLQSLIKYLLEIGDYAIEIIVVDSQQSKDKTQNLCQQFNVKYLKIGLANRAKQMNVGASIAQGEILCFLHADVVPCQNFIIQIRDTISNGIDFGFFSYQFSPSNFWLNANAYFTRFDGIFSGGGDQIHFINKTVFKDLGGYNESMAMMEDFHFFEKIKKNKIPYKLIHEPILVSSRKYNNNTYWWVNAVNLYVFVLYKVGISTQKLKQIYSKALKPY